MELGRESRKLMEQLHHLKAKRVCVEAGHIYADKSVAEEQIISFRIGAAVCELLKSKSITPLPMVLIDNYNASMNDFDVVTYLAVAKECGFALDDERVILEGDMQQHAHDIICQLRDENCIKKGPRESLFTSRYNIQLVHTDGRLSCPLLDSAFSLFRFKKHDFDITILPQDSPEHNYKKQQQNVRRILRLLGVNPIPLANAFFDKEGVVIFVRYK